MRIKKTILKDFLNKATMDGGETINEARLDFKETGLNISAVASSLVSMVFGQLNSGTFSDYEAIGEIGVSNIKTLVRVINSFKSEIEIIVQGNVIILKEGSRSVDVELSSLQYIAASRTAPKLEFGESFEIQADLIHSFIKDASVNSEFHIYIATVPQGLMLSNTGTYKFRENIVNTAIVGGFKTKYGSGLVAAFKNLSGLVKISMKTDYPIKIEEVTDDYSLTIISAPVMDAK